MNRTFRWPAAVLPLLVMFIIAGCNGDPDSDTSDGAHNHDHGSGHSHEHTAPETYAEALEEAEELYAKIKEGFEADDIDAAHGPLHDIGHVLEALPELAAETSLSEEDQQKVKTSVDSLMDSYGAVDERLHADDTVGKSYDDVAETIDEAMADLKAIKIPESDS